MHTTNQQQQWHEDIPVMENILIMHGVWLLSPQNPMANPLQPKSDNSLNYKNIAVHNNNENSIDLVV